MMIFKFQSRFIIQKVDADQNKCLLFLDYLSPRSGITGVGVKLNSSQLSNTSAWLYNFNSSLFALIKIYFVLISHLVEKGPDTLLNTHICINDENFETGIVKTIKWGLNK